MKPSMFNLVKEEETGLTLYNTLTGGILILNPAYAEQYRRFLDQGGKSGASDELLENLKKGGMAVDDALDEFQLLRVMHLSQRFSAPTLSLTIAPTLSCNFACPYCFENGRRYHTMTDETIAASLAFIMRSMKGKKELGITWYGGEPLLALDTMRTFTQELQKEGIPLSAAIATNGYLLTRETALALRDNQVRHAQVTLDGPREEHDQRRYLVNKAGTFDVIMKNLRDSCDILPISIRVNVDKNNMGSVRRLLDALDENGLTGKVPLYIAPIDNVNGTCNISVCFADFEFSNAQIDFHKQHLGRGYFFLHVPSCNPGLCGAVNASSALIAPTGDLYKCWDDVGNIEERIGTVFDGQAAPSPKLIQWRSYEPFSEECRACPVAPICMGGCPNQRIKKGKPFCHAMKYRPQDYIELFKKQKQQKPYAKT